MNKINKTTAFSLFLVFVVLLVLVIRNRAVKEYDIHEEFVENKNAKNIMNGDYIEIDTHQADKEIVVLYNEKETTISRNTTDIITLDKLNMCYYGRRYYGATTPKDLYVIDISNITNGTIIIKGAFSATINEDSDTFVYTYDNENIIYDTVQNSLYIDKNN